MKATLSREFTRIDTSKATRNTGGIAHTENAIREKDSGVCASVCACVYIYINVYGTVNPSEMEEINTQKVRPTQTDRRTARNTRLDHKRFD